jgi:hypothetical protein
MKGFPITLASYKMSLQMAAPSESVEKRSFIWSVRGRTASSRHNFVIVTYKVYTVYAGLFIRWILIGRATLTDFHIENVFPVNYKIV